MDTETAKDDPRGYVGRVFEEVFEDLYAARAQKHEDEQAKAAAAKVKTSDAGSQDDDAGSEAKEQKEEEVVAGELSFADEDALINNIGSQLKHDTERMREVKERLHKQQDDAQERDRQIAMFLKS